MVLVEASDLTRAASYAPRVTSTQRRQMREDALRAADELFGRLLREVDAERDAVLVVAPVAPAGEPALGVAALSAPGAPDGLLRTATTRRDGYVQLADVTPTILHLLGAEQPDEIEGRSFRATTTSDEPRREGLVAAAEAAEFRDQMLPVVTIAFIVVLALLLLAVYRRANLADPARAAIPHVGHGVLGAVCGTYLVGFADPPVSEIGRLVAWVVGAAVLVSVLALLAERRWAGAGTVVALGAVLTVIAVDVLVGAPLQVNTTFGYSVAVAGRFSGLGNLAFAIFGSAAVLMAAVLAERFGDRGRQAGLIVLAVVLLIEGLPMLGADVGGILAMVPAFGITAWILAGRPVRWSTVLWFGAAAGATVLLFAFVDWARPVANQTHLSRLAEHVVDGRWTTFFTSLSRRWQASFGGPASAAWATVGILVAAVVAYVVLVAVRQIGPRALPRHRHRPTMAALSGLAVLALVGLVANDSSFAVPATMLIIVVPVAVDRVVRLDGRAAELRRAEVPVEVAL